MFMTLTGELSWQRLRRSAVNFYSKERKNRSSSYPLWHLGVTYALHLWLVGKPVIDFLFVVIELFRYLLRLRRYERKSPFLEGGGSLWAQISERMGRFPPNTVGTRVAEWLPFCGIKISVMRHLVLSQCTSVKRTDRQTDRRDGPNYDSQDRPHICSRGKNYAVQMR